MCAVPQSAISGAERNEMLDINRQQRQFYEQRRTQRGNSPTRLWRHGRELAWRWCSVVGATATVHNLHREWLGDLQGKRVLDLGCYTGNPLSLEIAQASTSYLGLDLSEPAVQVLQEQLRARQLDHATARSGDFLSPEFDAEQFDVVYACAVMHHFKHFEYFLELVWSRLSPGGCIVSYDAMNTSWLLRLSRACYRPFQSDAAWEYPFSRKSFDCIEKYFEIRSIQGILGMGKWGLPLLLLPRGQKAMRYMHSYDLRHANRLGPALWRCMHVALHLQRRDVPLESGGALDAPRVPGLKVPT